MTQSPMISVEELTSSQPMPTLLDVRWQLGGPPGHGEYVEGHIPGASYVDLDTDLADPPGDCGRHPLPDPDRFVSAMRRCGVRNDGPVVVYDANTSMSAARGWWLLRHYGHSDVRVLDGGYVAWVQAGNPVHTGAGLDGPGDFTGGPGAMPVVEVDEVPGFVTHGLLLDARAPERYRGEHEPVDPVAGHIPGAVNRPASDNVVPGDGRLRETGDLASLYESVGVRDDRETGVYCGSGVTAAHGVLALAVLGRDAALYPGSWSEWVADPERRVVTGEQPHATDEQ